MKFVKILSLVLFVLMVFTCSTAAAKPLVLKFACFEPTPSLFNQKVFIPTVENINKEAKGIFKIDMYTGGTLGGDVFKQLKILKDGIADIALIINPYHPGRFADEEMLGMPFATDNCVECTEVINEMREENLLRGYDDLVVFGQICLGTNMLSTNLPVKSPSDLKGVKIRTGDKAQNPLVKAMGGTPVGMGADKTSEALSRGLVNGTITGWLGMAIFGYGELLSNHVMIPLGTNALSVVMTKKKYDSLPGEVKAILDKYKGEYLTNLWVGTLDGAMNGLKQKFKSDPKVTFYTPTGADMEEWRALIDPVTEEWKKKNKREAQTYEIFLKKIEKYRAGK